MKKRNILALALLACSMPPLAFAENAAQNRIKKAAEYRDSKEAVEQQASPFPESENPRADAPKERRPQEEGKSLENLLEGLLKSGEPR